MEKRRVTKVQTWSQQDSEIVVTSHLVEMAELDGPPFTVDTSAERSRFNDLAAQVAITGATGATPDALWLELFDASRALSVQGPQALPGEAPEPHGEA
jgi:hypothetical protein